MWQLQLEAPMISPFQVDAERVQLLGAAFTVFVNELLVAETARAGLAGTSLRINSQDETADGGVDAQLSRSVDTQWIPAGESAWQFKRGDCEPEKCRQELRGAKFAHDLLERGASYRLVLGRRLDPDKIERRLEALRDEADQLGLLDASVPSQFEIMDANSLARWASEFPPIAQSPTLGVLSPVVLQYNSWASGNRYQERWVPDDERSDFIKAIREVIGSEILDLRIIGPSGIGKTRLALEVLRDEGLEPIVAYLPSAASADPSLIASAVGSETTMVLVVDECSPRQHELLARQIPTGATMRLLSIGDGDDQADYPLQCPIWNLGPLAEKELGTFLELNFPTLQVDGRRVIIDFAAGNVRMAGLLARRILESAPEVVAEIIRSGDLTELLSLTVPEGTDFLVASTLALFERVGVDDEIAHELESVSTFCDVDEERVRESIERLERLGVVERKGRYRQVAPAPLATYLAAESWRGSGRRIVSTLIPSLDPQLLHALMRQAANLGRYEPARRVLSDLLDSGGPLGSLETIGRLGLSELLIHLAVVAPSETTVRLSRMILDSSETELEELTGVRRDLVWALEKLAWNTATFEAAADALLRLALAENETFSNNATGIWLSLFGCMLPATAALPTTRLQYLRRYADSDDKRVQQLVVTAAASALPHHEAVSISGERQGGSVVESRGTPATYGDAADYRVSMAGILRELADNPDPDVAASATEGLVKAIHPLADDGLVWPRLSGILMSLEGAALQDVRREVEGVLDLHREFDDLLGIDAEPVRGHASVIAAVEQLLPELPAAPPIEALLERSARRPWSFTDSAEAQEELVRLIADAIDREGLDTVADVLDEDVTGAWYIGQALFRAYGSRSTLAALSTRLPASIVTLAGYLAEWSETEGIDAFDSFLNDDAAELAPDLQVNLLCRGPATAAARARFLSLVPQLPVVPTIYGAGPWLLRTDEALQNAALDGWLQRAASTDDYEALVDWAAMVIHRETSASPERRSLLSQLIQMRSSMTDLRNISWDWCQIASMVAKSDPVGVGLQIVDLMSSGEILLSSSEEAAVLRQCAESAPEEIWQEVSTRVLGQDWRLRTSIRGWLVQAIPLELVSGWLGDSMEHAEALAAIVSTGRAELTPYALLLLEGFGKSTLVQSELASEFLSGTWTGPESRRLRGQIEQVRGWLGRPDYSGPAHDFARSMLRSLEAELERAQLREAEERW